MKSSVVVIAVILCLFAVMCNAQTATPTSSPTTTSSSTATPTPSPTTTASPTTTTAAPTKSPSVTYAPGATVAPTQITNVFGCVLLPANVVGAKSSSTAMGIFLATYDGANTVYWSLMHNVASANAVNYHDNANYTSTSPASTTLLFSGASTTGGPATSALTLTQGAFSISGSQIGNLFNNLQYVDVSSPTYPGGEIRGNVGLAPYAFQVVGTATGPQVPGTFSKSAAVGLFLGGSSSAGFLSGNFIHNVTSASSVIIGQASACSTGATVLTYPALTNGATQNVFSSVSNSTLTAFNAGQLFIQVNSPTYPNGEIRGQLVPTTSYAGLGGVTVPTYQNCATSPNPSPTPTATSGTMDKVVGTFAVVVVVMMSVFFL